MHKIIEISAEEILPEVEDVLKAQGIPAHDDVQPRTIELAGSALAAFRVLAQPKGLVMEITPEQFEPVYEGQGQNAQPNPLGDIYRQAESLALFAVTTGETIGQEIARQFDVNEYAPAAMLDAAASEGTERLANELEQNYREHLAKNNRLDSSRGTLQFSPGYCGWHISAQKKLFDTLHPEEIDIYLNDSFLMQPLKSISGVIVAGPKEIFEFEDNFEFCDECRTRSCRERIDRLKET